MRPMAVLMIAVSELPNLRPVQCMPVNTARNAIAAARGNENTRDDRETVARD